MLQRPTFSDLSFSRVESDTALPVNRACDDRRDDGRNIVAKLRRRVLLSLSAIYFPCRRCACESNVPTRWRSRARAELINDVTRVARARIYLSLSRKNDVALASEEPRKRERRNKSATVSSRLTAGSVLSGRCFARAYIYLFLFRHTPKGAPIRRR